MRAGSPDELAYEPGSRAELLSASHVFTAELTAVTGTSWLPAADGLEHRTVQLAGRLLTVFKQVPPLVGGPDFALAFEQVRESEFFQSDYHGLWSEVVPQPQAGVRYLVLADAHLDDPAALLRDGPCRRLVDADGTVDAELALSGERIWATVAEPERAAALLELARGRHGEIGELFAGYLWARVARAALADPERFLTGLLALVTRTDVAAPARLVLASEATSEIAEQTDPLLPRRVATRALLPLAAMDDPSGVRESVVDIQLYNLVFAHEQPWLDPVDVIGSAGERAALAAALERMPSPRAAALAQWLSGGLGPAGGVA